MKTFKHIIRDIYFQMLAKVAPRKLASVHYYRAFRKHLNWENPQDINEKINWLKFNSDTSQWSILADKYRVREFVKERGCGNMLVRLYGKWDKAEDIEWDKLPQQFVLKTNHGSGDVFICHDKSKMDTSSTVAQYRELLKQKFGDNMAEPHYNRISPCIIAEELLDCRLQSMESNSLIDYKVWCFDGKAAYVWVTYDRTKECTYANVYDLDWNVHPEYSVFTGHYRDGKGKVPKPKAFDDLINAAEALSQGFPEVRVDLYEVDGKPYFGELTFTSAGGFMDFYSEKFLRILGEHCHLRPLK